MCAFDDGCDQAVFHREKIVTAAKPYRCSECRGPILTGERHEYVVARWPDYLGTYRTCNVCMNGVRQWLVDLCDGWLYDGVMEDAIEHAEDPEGHGLYDEDLERLYGALVCKWTASPARMSDNQQP